MEKITLERIEELHPLVVEEVKLAVNTLLTQGITIRIVQGLRSFKEQDALYAQGRTAPGNIVTNAKGGQSYHNFGLAVDFCLVHKDNSISWNMTEDMNGDKVSDWNQVVKVFTDLGWSWGGLWKFKDNPHFEKTFGYNFQQLCNIPKDSKGYPMLRSMV